MTKILIQATRVGQYAIESLEHTSSGKVAGVTSKGVFFLFGRNSVFLTRSQYHSPFNISIPTEISIPDSLQTGDEAFYSLGDLLVPERQMTIALTGAEIWIPPAPKKALKSPVERVQRIQSIIRQLDEKFANKGFLYLSNNRHQLSDGELSVQTAVKKFAAAFAAEDDKFCLAAAHDLFGLGSGLTPSGDDLITGFILMQTRLNDPGRRDDSFLHQIGPELIQMAYQRTTWISANRLEASLHGWSEELFLHLIDVIDGNSQDEDSRLAGELYEFGHSSGVDTFMGIALAAGAIM